MSVGLWQDAMVEILGGSSQNESAFFFQMWDRREILSAKGVERGGGPHSADSVGNEVFFYR